MGSGAGQEHERRGGEDAGLRAGAWCISCVKSVAAWGGLVSRLAKQRERVQASQLEALQDSRRKASARHGTARLQLTRSTRTVRGSVGTSWYQG